MAEQQLIDYIKKAKLAEQQDTQTRALLAKNGWTEAEINDAFAAIGQAPAETRQPMAGQPQVKTQTQVSGQPKIDIKPQAQASIQPATQPQYSKPRPEPAVQASQPQYQPQAAQNSAMPETKHKSHLLLKIFVVLIIVIILAGAGLYSADKFFNVKVLSYLHINIPDSWNLSEPNPQTVLDKMTANMGGLKSYATSVQTQMSISAGNVTQGTMLLTLSGKGDSTDAANPKSEANLSFALSPAGSSSPVISANIDAIAVNNIAYLRVNDFVLPAESIPFDISQIKGKYLKIDQDSAKALSQVGNSSTTVPDLSQQNSMELSKKIQDLVLSENMLSVSSKLPVEKVAGQDTYHYLLTIPKDKIKDLMGKLITLESQQLSGAQLPSADIQQQMNLITDALGDINAEVWIGKSDYMLYKMKIVKSFDVGKIVPILNLQVNAQIDATYSDFNKPISIQEPTDFQKIEDFILPLIKAQEITNGVSTIGFYASSIYGESSNYSTLCVKGMLNGYQKNFGESLISQNNTIMGGGATRPVCFATKLDYCVSTQLPDGSFACADKNGIGKIQCVSAQTVCAQPSAAGLPQ